MAFPWRHVPSSVANLLLTTEPVFTMVTAYVLVGERLHGIQVAGRLLILGGALLLRIHEGRPAIRSSRNPHLLATQAARSGARSL